MIGRPATRRPSRIAVALAAVLAAAFAGLAGCGGSTPRLADRIDGPTLTVYSSAPLIGPSGVQGQAVVNAERMALSNIHNRIGKYRIAFVSLNDATVRRRGWDPGQTTANAKLAAANPDTIGYIGELDSGASAISIPILNRAGIPQISPASTGVGLTSGAPGASPGEPQKYYPTRMRTFARVIPNDSVQAVAQVRMQQSMGCLKTFVLDDGKVDGYDAATSFALAAASYHLVLVGMQAYDPAAANYLSLARAVGQSGAGCVLICAATESNAASLTEQIADSLPDVLLFGSAGLAESTYTSPGQGGIPISIDPRVTITAAALAPGDYPRAGRAFLTAYARRYGEPEPDAIFGYEAMSLMLDAIGRATENGTGPVDRLKVLRAVFSTRNRHSVLGTYSIDSDGDTTLNRFGAYRVVDGRLEFLAAIGT